MQTRLICLVLGFVLNARADGIINFFTYNANSAYGRVYNWCTGQIITTNFFGQLMAGPSAGSIAPIGVPIRFQVINGIPAVVGSNVTVSGVGAGTPYYYALRVWDGPSYAQASTAFGTSGTVQVILGGTDDSGGFFAPPQANGFHTFGIGPLTCPEVFNVSPSGTNILIAWNYVYR